MGNRYALSRQSSRTGHEGAIPFHVDGEPRLAQDELVVLTHPRALRVKVPVEVAQASGRERP